jgi:hypothetical protein
MMHTKDTNSLEMLVFRASASLRARSTTLSSMLNASLVAAISSPYAHCF